MIFVRCIEKNLESPQYRRKVFLNGEEIKDKLFLSNLLAWLERTNLAERIVVFEHPKNAPNFRDTVYIVHAEFLGKLKKSKT